MHFSIETMASRPQLLWLSSRVSGLEIVFFLSSSVISGVLGLRPFALRGAGQQQRGPGGHARAQVRAWLADPADSPGQQRKDGKMWSEGRDGPAPAGGGLMQYGMGSKCD